MRKERCFPLFGQLVHLSHAEAWTMNAGNVSYGQTWTYMDGYGLLPFSSFPRRRESSKLLYSMDFRLRGNDNIEAFSYSRTAWLVGGVKEKIHNGFNEPDHHNLIWNASGYPAGTYFIQMIEPDSKHIVKSILVK